MGVQITAIREYTKVKQYLQKRTFLLSQYKKAKNYLLLGKVREVNFKKRKPKEACIFSFRINKKYRALCYVENNILTVFKIDDHQ